MIKVGSMYPGLLPAVMKARNLFEMDTSESEADKLLLCVSAPASCLRGNSEFTDWFLCVFNHTVSSAGTI
jgi:hypothetical protein